MAEGGFVRLPDGSVVVALALPRPGAPGRAVRVLVHAANRSRALTRLRNLGRALGPPAGERRAAHPGRDLGRAAPPRGRRLALGRRGRHGELAPDHAPAAAPPGGGLSPRGRT